MKQNFQKKIYFLLAALAFVLGSSGYAAAQEITGSLNGTVRDSTGASVAGATVTISDPTKNNIAVRTLTTSDEGTFSAPNLQSGIYQVAVEAANFKKSVQTDVKLDVGQRRTVEFALDAGNISETVTVQAEAVAVNLSTPTAGTTISGDQVRELSVNNRNFIQLVTLAPGVTSNLSDQVFVGTTNPDGQANTVNISVNGARSSQNTFTVDGADITDRGSNITIQAYPSIDSIGEFKVLRSLFPAESGRSGGGQVNVITRSGTDKFHGSLYEFVRNEKFNANSYFNNQRAPLGVDSNGKARRIPFRYNDYGFTIGGPVFGPNFGEGNGGLFERYKKTYFFFSEEQRKDRRSTTLISSVPDAGVRQGIFPIDICLSATISGATRTCNNILPAGTPLASRAAINPVAQSYLTNIYNKIPLPNNPAVPFQLFAPVSAKADFRQELIKIDTSFTKNWSAFYRYERDTIPTIDVNGIFSFGTFIPGVSTAQTESPGRTHTFQTTYVVSPNVIIEGRYTYAYGAILSQSIGLLARANSPINVSLPFAVVDDRVPTISGNGFNGLGSFGPYDNFSNKNDFGASLTWISGRHSFKFGGDYSKYRKHENRLGGNNQGSFSTFSNTNAALVGATQGSVCAPSQQTATTGCVTTNNAGNLQAFANFLLGSNVSFSQAKFDLTADFRQQNFEGFAQDEFRLRPNLTLYYGVRYSYFGSPYDKNGHLTNFDPSVYNPANAPQVTGTGIRVPGTGNFCNGLIINSQNVPSLLPPDCRPTISPFGKYVVKVSKTNFAPRVGLAWDPFGKGRTSIRTGYGIYHEQTLVGTFEQNLGTNPPYQQVCNPNFVSLNNVDPTGACQSSGFSVSQSIRAVDPNYKTPYTQDYSFDVQQQLGRNTFLDVGYYGSKGTNLIGIIDIDLLPPGFALTQNCATGLNTLSTPGATLVPCQLPGAPLLSSTLINQIRPYRGYSAINIIKPIFNSRYNSLQVSAQHRFTVVSQVNLAYTYSKAITDAQTDRSSAPQNPYNIKAETGRAALDRRHVLTANYIYELPFFQKQNGFVGKALGGWESSGIFTYQTGLPFTVTGGFDPAGIGFFGPSAAGPRPDQIGDPNSNAPHTQQQFFNTSAFPSAFQVSGVPAIPGSAGRGAVNGPRTVRFDFTLIKNIRFGESMNLQLRGEAFNIFNTTNFTTLNTSAGSTTFGQVTGTRDPRTLQFGAKFYF